MIFSLKNYINSYQWNYHIRFTWSDAKKAIRMRLLDQMRLDLTRMRSLDQTRPNLTRTYHTQPTKPDLIKLGHPTWSAGMTWPDQTRPNHPIRSNWTQLGFDYPNQLRKTSFIKKRRVLGCKAHWTTLLLLSPEPFVWHKHSRSTTSLCANFFLCTRLLENSMVKLDPFNIIKTLA